MFTSKFTYKEIMKIKKTTAFIIIFIIISSVLAFGHYVKAISAPQIFFTGDDTNQNGGTDDAYDSLIVVDIDTSQPGFTNYQLEYSTDGGVNWQTDLVVDDESISGNRRKYYWSASVIGYAPVLLFRARSVHGTEYSEYYQAILALAHRSTDANNHFFAEHFITTDFRDNGQTTANWDTVSGFVELPQPSQKYLSPRQAVSLDLLGAVSNNQITGVVFQPVQYGFGQTIEYYLSNNGSNWLGPYVFTGVVVPPPQNIAFATVGDKLFWKAVLTAADKDYSPRVYQLRFFWTENYLPQACFTVTPASNLADPSQQYLFDADCSSDYEDPLNQLDFRWDWDNDGSFDTTWLTGGYSQAHVFNATTTFTINLEVRDSNEAVDSYQSSINQESLAGDVYGWLWSGHYGWTSLNCDNTYYGTNLNLCGGIDYGLLMDEQNISGWAYNPYLGWLCMGESCSAYGNTPDAGAPFAIYSRSTGEINGWGKFINIRDSSGQAVWDQIGWLQLRNASWCNPPDYDCAYLDFGQRKIGGFAWAGGYLPGSLELTGPGWQQFSGNINLPWLETLYGSVYSKNQVGSNATIVPPAGRYSASYCILSGGEVINFTSGLDCVEANYREIDFPTSANQYRNILGVIDFNEILNGEETVFEQTEVSGTLPTTLDGGVYYFTSAGQSDYYINQPLTIYNARNLFSSGAGTVVINGNLHINSNIYYETAPVSGKISNLASMAWIVKGDVIIDPAVTQIVGSFIILGQDGIACPNADCGRLLTGNDSANPKQLVLKGLVLAKQINFQRYYKVNQASAEQFIYDGRAMVNTPPGLSDLTKALPIWREAFATQEIE